MSSDRAIDSIFESRGDRTGQKGGARRRSIFFGDLKGLENLLAVERMGERFVHLCVLLVYVHVEVYFILGRNGGLGALSGRRRTMCPSYLLNETLKWSVKPASPLLWLRCFLQTLETWCRALPHSEKSSWKVSGTGNTRPTTRLPLLCCYHLINCYYNI